MERRISVGPKYVNHLQRWSRIFRSEETETNLTIWIPTEISGIFDIMESTKHNNIDNSYYNIPKWSIPILNDKFGKCKMSIIAAYIYNNNFILQNEK